MRLHRSDALLVVIDVQERLMPVIDGADDVVANIERLVRGCKLLDVPAILTEQYVKGLGPTVAPLRATFEETHGYEPIEKACFSSYGCGEFVAALRNLRKKQLLVAGVETHVCVWQTVLDLLGNGYDVSVVADAVSSRTPRNRDIALRRMEREGAHLTTTEMALFELLVTSGTDEFRAISKLVK